MLWQLILKDIRLFLTDRRALMISLFVPIAIASFMAFIFGNAGKAAQSAKIGMLIVDNDKSEMSAKIIENIRASSNLVPTVVEQEKAYADVKAGKSATALVLPKGFQAQAQGALTGGDKPVITMVTDPAQSTQAQVIQGGVMQPIMQAVFKAGPEMKPPFEFKEESQVDKHADTGSIAHVFAGMGVQGLLFFSIESAMAMMRERKQGIWKRQRAAPVSPFILVFARILSGSLRALAILAGVFGFGMLVFHFSVQGSFLGFALVAIGAALMASCFGLFVAALGKTEQQSRGLAIMVVLTMTMLGGAWFPSFLMPDWVQKVALVIPVKWAVDGFDAMTWRGGDLSSVLASVGALLVFAVVFGLVAFTRFRWDAEGAT